MHEPPDSLSARPGLLSLLLAPWRGITHPMAAGRTLARSGWLGLLATFILTIAVIAAANILFALVYETHQTNYYGGLDYGYAPGKETDPVYVESTLATTWERWCTRERINPALIIAGAISGNTCIVSAVLTLLFFHRVHRAGPFWSALRRTAAAVVTALGFAFVLNAVIWTGFILLEIQRYYGGVWRETPIIFNVLSIQSSILLILHWIGRAAIGASDESFVLELSPRCEACGYDLTHRPDSGLCPECNAPVAASLEPGRRQPSAYERGGDPAAFVDTSRRILFRPTETYGALAMIGPLDRARQFRRLHLAAMMAGAALWMFSLMTWKGGRAPDGDEAFVPIAVGLVTGIVAWTVTHLAGMVAGFYWLYHRTLPDTRLVQRIACLETPFVWLFCGLSGTLVTSFMVWGDWIGRSFFPVINLFGVRVPTAPLLVLGTNLAAVVGWVIRWLRIGRCVRWSNY